MDKLSAVSYYLSYTEFIPVVSTLSAIAHLICAIRDCIFGAPVINHNDSDDVIKMSERKLDDWSHSAKAICAIIPLLGNAILVFKWINRTADVSSVNSYCKGEGDNFLDSIPKKLWDDQEFVFALMKAREYSRSQVFEHTSTRLIGDKNFILRLAKEGFIESLKGADLSANLLADKEVVLAIIDKHSMPSEFFKNLTEALKNDLIVIKKTYESVKKKDKFYMEWNYGFLKLVTDKDLLKSDDALYLQAIRQRIFNFQDLDESHRNREDYVRLIVGNNYEVWNELPDHLKNNRKILRSALVELRSREDYTFDRMKDTDLYRFVFTNHPKKPVSVMQLRYNLNDWLPE